MHNQLCHYFGQYTNKYSCKDVIISSLSKVCVMSEYGVCLQLGNQNSVYGPTAPSSAI